MNLNDLLGFRLSAEGEPVAVLRDLLLGGSGAVVRYLVAESEAWLETSRVLLAPRVVVAADRAECVVRIGVDRDALAGAPGLRRGTSVTRAHEALLHGHFGWPPYWEEPGGEDDPPVSARHLVGFYVKATDGAVGHVEDLIIDLEGWRVRYLMIDVGNWLPGRRVLAAADWLRAIEPARRTVVLGVARELVSSCRRYDRTAALELGLDEALEREDGRARDG